MGKSPNSVVAPWIPRILRLGVWVGDDGGVSCLCLEVVGVVKIELLALAINLPLESLAICCHFLFIFLSQANN